MATLRDTKIQQIVIGDQRQLFASDILHREHIMQRLFIREIFAVLEAKQPLQHIVAIPLIPVQQLEFVHLLLAVHLHHALLFLAPFINLRVEMKHLALHFLHVLDRQLRHLLRGQHLAAQTLDLLLVLLIISAQFIHFVLQLLHFLPLGVPLLAQFAEHLLLFRTLVASYFGELPFFAARNHRHLTLVAIKRVIAFDEQLAVFIHGSIAHHHVVPRHLIVH
mmetsp:Transcript_14786/g.23106  ORF Transcript_14786/g.23106 Transcript_14786/m.23106 type:complete len:221 (-) Transcript_14786:572-1234(-)